NPAAPVLLKPGMPVSVRVDVAANDTLRLQIAAILKKRLQAAGLNPSDGTPIILSFQAVLTTTADHSKVGRAAGTAPPGAGASHQKLSFSASLGDNRGNTWWTQASSANPSNVNLDTLPRDEDARARENRQWQGAIQFAAQLVLPNRVYML